MRIFLLNYCPFGQFYYVVSKLNMNKDFENFKWNKIGKANNLQSDIQELNGDLDFKCEP